MDNYKKAITGFAGTYEKAIFAAALFIWLFVVAAFFASNNHYKKVYLDDLGDSSSLLYGIDSISAQDAQIRGWCLKPGASIETFDISIILWSDRLGYGYTVPAKLQDRTDVTAYMEDGCNYDHSGFLCQVNQHSVVQEAYQIFIQYGCNGGREVVSTGQYYVSGYDVVYQQPEPSEKLRCNIDEISAADAKISGWCIEEGKAAGHVQMNLILWDETNRYGYQLPVSLESREDITEYFNEGTDYDNAGFLCTFDNSWIKEGDYHIYIRYRCDGTDEVADTRREYSYHAKTDADT